MDIEANEVVLSLKHFRRMPTNMWLNLEDVRETPERAGIAPISIWSRATIVMQLVKLQRVTVIAEIKFEIAFSFDVLRG